MGFFMACLGLTVSAPVDDSPVEVRRLLASRTESARLKTDSLLKDVPSLLLLLLLVPRGSLGSQNQEDLSLPLLLARIAICVSLLIPKSARLVARLCTCGRAPTRSNLGEHDLRFFGCWVHSFAGLTSSVRVSSSSSSSFCVWLSSLEKSFTFSSVLFMLRLSAGCAEFSCCAVVLLFDLL